MSRNKSTAASGRISFASARFARRLGASALGLLAAAGAFLAERTAEAAPFTQNDPLPWALSGVIAGNDSPTNVDLLNFLDTVTLPDDRVFDTSAAMVLEARVLDSNVQSDGSDGAQAAGWLQRTCFDDAGASVTCNEATNGYWWHQGGLAEELYIAVYKVGKAFVAGVYANPVTSAGVPAYDGQPAPNPTTVIYNTGGGDQLAARYFDAGDDMSLIGLNGQGLSHLSVYTLRTEIPLPPAFALFALGLAGLGALRFRRT